MSMGLAVMIAATAMTGCGNSAKSGSSDSADKKVVIYSNADDEAITAMQNALDNNGYKGKYLSLIHI